MLIWPQQKPNFEGSKEMRYTPKKPIQFATLTKIALKRSSWRRGLMKRIEIIDRQFVYGKAGPKDAVLMSKPHMFTAEAQHDGSKEMQCTSKKFWFQTFNKDWNVLKTVIGEQGPRKLLKITRQQLALGQPDGRTPSIFASQPLLATERAQHERLKDMQWHL